ncbi:triacylglycerol lipase [Streptomyces sp. DH37]|uniref:esterase/lipase family protein n=1 Tax=Streptomyces sp. DH37 TaxID=3040122 RepID=UPI002442D855|nr:triacylglycerol lipase [Streptomyces sp. DH37]MDG9702686.1 triacylglycerol lipase [Streptomyces sp. DH37]
MKKPLAVAATALSALALALQAPSPAAATAASPTAYGPGSDPILFVHGWSSSGSVWNTMAGRFRADGWPSTHLRQWSYDTGQSNATTAQQVAAEVDRLLAATGASRVDVITHSMGGLSSRHYAKNLGGAAKIDAWVSLGGPNHGTDTANACFQTSCTEMRIGSRFLTDLNSGNETPGSPRYATWWSPCDSVINPDSSVSLSGAVNTRTACLSHSGLLEDATVYGQVRDMADG